MKVLIERAFFMGFGIAGMFLPGQANATTAPNTDPEQVSLALLAVGTAGVGAVAWIRRRKDK